MFEVGGGRDEAMRRELDPANSQHALLCQHLMRAANDGYDVSPLIDHGADPGAAGMYRLPPRSGANRLPRWERTAAAAGRRALAACKTSACSAARARPFARALGLRGSLWARAAPWPTAPLGPPREMERAALPPCVRLCGRWRLPWSWLYARPRPPTLHAQMWTDAWPSTMRP